MQASRAQAATAPPTLTLQSWKRRAPLLSPSRKVSPCLARQLEADRPSPLQHGGGTHRHSLFAEPAIVQQRSPPSGLARPCPEGHSLLSLPGIPLTLARH